jgi:hypothetical protein
VYFRRATVIVSNRTVSTCIANKPNRPTHSLDYSTHDFNFIAGLRFFQGSGSLNVHHFHSPFAASIAAERPLMALSNRASMSANFTQKWRLEMAVSCASIATLIGTTTSPGPASFRNSVQREM